MSEPDDSPVTLLKDHLGTVRLSLEYFKASLMCVNEGTAMYHALKMACEAYAMQAQFLVNRIESMGGTADEDG